MGTAATVSARALESRPIAEIVGLNGWFGAFLDVSHWARKRDEEKAVQLYDGRRRSLVLCRGRRREHLQE